MSNHKMENCTNYIFDDAPMTVELRVSMALILSVFLVLSVVGNVCTCIVIIRNKSLRSPTNYYLLNLAISDLIFSSFIPVELCIYYIPDFASGGDLFIAHFFFFELLGNFSVLTILAFTVERYLAITRPFSCNKSTLTSRVFRTIATIWVLSIFFSSLTTSWIYKANKESFAAWFTAFYDDFHKYYVVVLLIVFFVLPLCIIVVLYVLIVLYLDSTKTMLRSNSLQTIRNKQRATKMLAAVAALFFICWSPYCVLRIMALMKYSYLDHLWVWHVMMCMCSINSYMSAVVNPILYSLMSRRFRQAFKNLLGVRAGSVKTSQLQSI